MESWRQVEVAACEELAGLLGAEGPTRVELEAIRGASFTVQAVNERERVTDHDMAAFVDVLGASGGEAGRWIHFGLTSSDVLDTALALQLRAVGEVIVPGAFALVAALHERAREHTPLDLRGAHARRARRADNLRGEARGLRLRGPSQRLAPAARVRAGGGRRGLRSGRHLRRDEPRLRDARARAAGPRARGRLHAGRRPRPPRRAVGRDRARRRRPRAVRDRDRAICSAPRCGRCRSRSAPGRRAQRRCPTSATRSRAEQICGPRARASRQRPGGPRERRAVARARHLPLLGRARDPARLDDPARLPAAQRRSRWSRA